MEIKRRDVCLGNPFLNGMKVKTTEEYYKQNKRRVSGVVVLPKGVTPHPIATPVRWLKQEGNIIKEQQDQVVIMVAEDLEKVNKLP